LRLLQQNFIVYDRIRTDNFKKPDPGWDIKGRGLNNELVEIDIKSSGPHQGTPNLSVILNKRNLATKPSIIRNGKIVEADEERAVNIQLYFLPQDSRYVYLISWCLYEDLISKGPPAKYLKSIGTYSPTNPRKRYNSILGTLRKMNELLFILS